MFWKSIDLAIKNRIDNWNKLETNECWMNKKQKLKEQDIPFQTSARPQY